MSIEDLIKFRLREEFGPSEIIVENESHRHRGHSGWDESGETHFRLVMKSSRFNGLTRIERHRLVFKSLSPDPMSRIHALRMELSGE